ncbi:MAG: 50S ribosomal protein L23 [Opitutae bacterium]|jgi:large subunit ribosomal protein L23|nr:50S ribosomal protein L23 [Opitutae bacterium]MBT4224317.1 50S ribosomal protein L23 [Opitutae bacterium]MBT5377838.1 50S ribosomal protein L23 [Opitutae bacterium]MBT5692218.1 50S ribosomal protein L23 [Opitutae bacterium]MBT6463675.1 50S ribosomal protein L23 [Opitutae bacterium]
MNSLDIILKYIITEKATEMASMDKYTFIVTPTATRAQVRQAVQHHFGDVEISKINIINRKGKIKSSRTRGLSASGRTASTKRAIVTLSKGKIDLV